MNGFPTYNKIKADYKRLTEELAKINSLAGLQEFAHRQRLTIEINGDLVKYYEISTFAEPIEWVRIEVWGCLSYVYCWADGRIMFDVWSDALYDEFIRDVTMDELTEEYYNNEIKAHI